MTILVTCGHAVLSPVWLSTPWTAARQAPLSMECPRQEHWSGLPLSSPGIFPTQGSNQGLLRCRRILYHWATWEAGSSSQPLTGNYCESPRSGLKVSRVIFQMFSTRDEEISEVREIQRWITGILFYRSATVWMFKSSQNSHAGIQRPKRWC